MARSPSVKRQSSGIARGSKLNEEGDASCASLLPRDEGADAGALQRINLLRRLAQTAFLAAVTLVILTGQVSIDAEAGRVHFFGAAVWPHETGLILIGMALPLAVLAVLSAALGRAFCGWLCPQTLLCELASWAQGEVTSSAGKSASPALSKRIFRLAGVAALGAAIAIGGGLIVVSALVSPGTAARLASGEVSTSLLKGFTVASLMVVIIVGVLRHTFCEWICLVGWWQRLFATKAGLRISFDAGRAKECTRCNRCRASCFMGIEPRRRALPSSCLNCGKCVSACSMEMAAAGANTLVGFRFGESRSGRASGGPSQAARLRGLSAGAIMLAVAILTVWLAQSRDSIQLRVHQVGAVDVIGGEAHGKYVVDVYNNRSVPVELSLGETGLPEGALRFGEDTVVVPPRSAASADVTLKARVEGLSTGRNVFRLTATDGHQQALSPRIVLAIAPSADAGGT